MLKKETVTKHIKQSTQDLIIEYLFDENPTSFDLLKRIHKKILVEQLVTIKKTIIGNKADKVQALFFALNLDYYVERKVRSIFWDTRVKYIQIAAIMNVIGVTEIVRKGVNDRNWVVRGSAQIALLTLDSNHSFYFLHNLKFTLSKWQQINLHHLIIRNSIPLPHFSDYILSQNDSVVLFALDMMEAFAQQEKKETVIRLLNHQNEEIRRKAIHYVKEFEVKEAFSVLLKRLPSEKLLVQTEIIETFVKFNTSESLEYINSVFPNTEFEINHTIVNSLSNKNLKYILQGKVITPEIDLMLKQISYK
jgi:hypothetical protein